MTIAAAARVEQPPDVAAGDAFWCRPHTAAELRAHLREVLLDELVDRGERGRRVIAATGIEPARRSPADILDLVDELVAQVRREEREHDRGTW